MDAVKFIKGYKRICDSRSNCADCIRCPLYDYEIEECLMDVSAFKSAPVNAVAVVEQWIKEHPAKTRQSEFLKMFPNAPLYSGVVWVDPCKVDKTFECQHCGDCSSECRRNYWLQEVE